MVKAQSKVCQDRRVVVVDLFSGAGGLSLGLRQAGMSIAAGIDVDPDCRFAYESNIEAPFLEMDVADVTPEHLDSLWPADCVRLLAGCAPCQPFSPYRRGVDTSGEDNWPLLDHFGRLVAATMPDLVTMENVPRVGSSVVFQRFVQNLRDRGYHVAWTICHGPKHGLPQNRRRLVLLASLLGPIDAPQPDQGDTPTVRQAIGHLPRLKSGQAHFSDPLHACRNLSEMNLRRLRASLPGGTWRDWPEDLRAPCHRRTTGASFGNVYARMSWDEPSPTITTLAHNFGAGRFGHPDQDRALSLREAAILQGFPEDYRFVPTGSKAQFSMIGRLIGNAVPPPIARSAGRAILEHLATTARRRVN